MRPAPRAIVATLLALTFTTGVVDAVCFLGLGRVFTANMTGNVVLLGFGLAGTDGLPVLAPLVAARPGLRVPGAWDGFELAVRAIFGQQITVPAATKLLGRLAAAHGAPLPVATREGD